jgi:hypothetical protein
VQAQGNPPPFPLPPIPTPLPNSNIPFPNQGSGQPTLPAYDLKFELKKVVNTGGSWSIVFKFLNPLPRPANYPSSAPDVTEGTLEVKELPAGTEFNTWTKPDTLTRWINENGPANDEMNYLVQSGAGASGGGLYTSLDSIDSMDFGPVVAIFHSTGIVHLVQTQPFISALNTQQNYAQQAGHLPMPNYLNAFNQQVRALAIDGDLYIAGTNNTWINMISTAPLQGVHQGTLDEVLNGVPRTITFQETMLLANKFTLSASPALQKTSPNAYQIYSGTPLTDDQWNAWFQDAFPGGGDASIGILANSLEGASNSAFLDLFFKLENSRLQDLFLKSLNLQDPKFHSIDASPIDYGSFNTQSTLFEFSGRVGFNHLLAKYQPFQFPKVTYSLPIAYLKRAVYTANPFEAQLENALPYVNYLQLVHAFALGSSEPWSVQDVPGQIPYAKQMQTAASASFASTFDGRLVGINQSLTSNSQYRSTRAFGVGTLFPDAKGGFYRVNEIQKQRLLNNPFITVELKTDPASHFPNPTYLARHEYVSAGNYDRVKSFLSASLVSNLDTAKTKGALKDAASPEFHDLTVKMMKELTIIGIASGDGFRVQQFLLFAHPFQERNEDTILAYSQSNGGMSAFTVYPLDAFTLSPPEYRYAKIVEANEFNWMRAILNNEMASNPEDPHFYDLPEWYMIADKIDQYPANLDAYVAERKAYYADPKNLEKDNDQKLLESSGVNCDKVFSGKL